MPGRLTVLYDETCVLCRRCRHWLEAQPTHLPVDFLAAGSAAARERYGDVPWLGADLVVVDNEGNVWAGPAAFVMCLWATTRYRTWAYRLSGRAFAPFAGRFFHVISSNRRRFGGLLDGGDCADGRCHHEAPPPAWALLVPAGAGAVVDDDMLPWPTVTPRPEPSSPICHACGAPTPAPGRYCWSCGTER